MKPRLLFAPLLLLAITVSAPAADKAPQSQLNPAKAAESKKYPTIVLYSVSWCPHCRATKEYFTQNNIPFINRDVEIDPQAMQELTGKYNSQGVPVIVINPGASEIVLKGFTPESFQDGVKKARARKK